MSVEKEAVREQRPWACNCRPSLDADEFGELYTDVPGYDFRRVMHAQYPVPVANVSFVQDRVILATVLGARMCPRCPHCARSGNPCHDVLCSSAELMGARRATDALFGAVGSQGSTGRLHYHLGVLIHRLHQYASMKEIADLLEAMMVHANELKYLLSNICCESDSDLGQYIADLGLLGGHPRRRDGHLVATPPSRRPLRGHPRRRRGHFVATLAVATAT